MNCFALPATVLLTALLSASAAAQHTTQPSALGITRSTSIGTGALPGLSLEPGESWSQVLAAPFATRDLGLWFAGDFAHAEVEFLRADQLLETWPLVEDHDQSPATFDPLALARRPAESLSVTGLAHSYLASADSVRLVLVGPADLTHLELVWIAPGPDLKQPAVVPPVAKLAGYPKPPVYGRASWGADAPQCGSSYCNTTHVAIHHTASSSDYAASTWSAAAANVKAIQAYHMYTNGWCDIGYNYLVTKQGWIFEGRAGGDNVKGAHDGFNCGSMGVAALGYFHTPINNPTTAALLDSLEELGAWKCDQQGINPLGSSYYAGYGAVQNNVYGHRDVKATACPGDLLYAKLGAVKSGIEARLNGAPTSGKLKGVLYDANLGTAFRLVGTVALANGSFVKTGSDGYYEFSLPAGSYTFAGTAPGHTAKAASETVGTGDVWESLGLFQGSVPAHVDTPLGGTLFNATFQGDPGSPVYLAYSGSPGIPIQPFAAAGNVWVDLPTAQVLLLGSVPASGTLSTNLQVTGAPVGTKLFTQAYLIWQGQARLTNGAAWQAQWLALRDDFDATDLEHGAIGQESVGLGVAERAHHAELVAGEQVEVVTSGGAAHLADLVGTPAQDVARCFARTALAHEYAARIEAPGQRVALAALFPQTLLASEDLLRAAQLLGLEVALERQSCFEHGDELEARFGSAGDFGRDLQGEHFVVGSAHGAEVRAGLEALGSEQAVSQLELGARRSVGGLVDGDLRRTTGSDVDAISTHLRLVGRSLGDLLDRGAAAERGQRLGPQLRTVGLHRTALVHEDPSHRVRRGPNLDPVLVEWFRGVGTADHTHTISAVQAPAQGIALVLAGG